MLYYISTIPRSDQRKEKNNSNPQKIAKHTACRHRRSKILTKISNYEMAYRMQTSVPKSWMSDEPDYIFDLYGEDSKIPVPLPPTVCSPENWLKKTSNSSSSTTAVGINTATYPMTSKDKPKKPIRPPLAHSRPQTKGLLEDTLVIWGGEFGRTNTPKGCSNPTTTVEITTPVVLPSLWLVQASKKASPLVLPTILATTSERPVHIHDFQATYAPAGH